MKFISAFKHKSYGTSAALSALSIDSTNDLLSKSLVDKDKIFNQAMDYIAGSCMVSTTMALEAVLGYHPGSALEDEFNQFLADNDCYECEFCGWWTHPGDYCDCEESQNDPDQ